MSFSTANDLSGALDALQDAGSRANPVGFETAYLPVPASLRDCGDWKRVPSSQLKLSRHDGTPKAVVEMAQAYREVIRCEVFREKVFAGERDPLVFRRTPMNGSRS